MSTKIYQGFKLDTTSLKEAKRMIDGFRPWVQKAAEEAMDAFIVNVQVARDIPVTKAMDVWYDLRAEMRKTGYNMPSVDTDFSLTLIPTDDGFIGVCYTVRKAWWKAWLEQNGVKEYGWWNNTDKPDEVSDEEWAERGDAWSIVNHDPMCMQGFSIDLVSPDGPTPKAWRTPENEET